MEGTGIRALSVSDTTLTHQVDNALRNGMDAAGHTRGKVVIMVR
jgi:hypothetical protein